MILDCIIIVFLIVITLWLFNIYKILYSHVYNDMQVRLSQAMYDELNDLPAQRQSEKALWSYFRNKLNDVYNRYVEAKQVGFHNISEHAFKKDLLGSGSSELNALYPKFPGQFLQRIDKINDECFDSFLDSVHLSASYKKDRLQMIQAATISFFRRNVRQILAQYNQIKYSITDPEQGNIQNGSSNMQNTGSTHNATTGNENTTLQKVKARDISINIK
jgi:hypothetical protein